MAREMQNSLGPQASCLHLGSQASSLREAGRMPVIPGTLHLCISLAHAVDIFERIWKISFSPFLIFPFLIGNVIHGRNLPLAIGP